MQRSCLIHFVAGARCPRGRHARHTGWRAHWRARAPRTRGKRAWPDAQDGPAALDAKRAACAERSSSRSPFRKSDVLGACKTCFGFWGAFWELPGIVIPRFFGAERRHECQCRVHLGAPSGSDVRPPPRSERQVEQRRLRARARQSVWAHALLSSWWCYAGHLARLADREPERCYFSQSSFRSEARAGGCRSA